MVREDPQMKIRLPEALLTQIRESAARNQRSMNAEVLAILDGFFAMTEGEIRVTIRFPASVHKRLKERAESDGRSFNAEIVHLLLGALQEDAEPAEALQ